MSKRAIIFPGQGAQYEGMGKALYDNFAEARLVYEEISEAVGFNIAEVSFGNLAGELGKTGFSQPAIFAHSMAAFSVYKSMGGGFCGMAGFSLGECTAVCAAGGLNVVDASRMIEARARLMQREAESSEGAMYAVMGADEMKLANLIGETVGYVEMVNFNCPGQIVIAGEAAAAAELARIASSSGLKVVRLNVNAAFHSKLMEKAAASFAIELKGMSFGSFDAGVYSNVTGSLLVSSTMTPSEYFPTQMLSPVRWQGLVEAMIADGYDDFVELGPSKTLQGMVRRISREVKIGGAEDADGIKALIV